MSTPVSNERVSELLKRFRAASAGDRAYEKPCTWDEAEALAELALSALRSQSPEPSSSEVRVKPLEWSVYKEGDKTFWRAPDPLGGYAFIRIHTNEVEGECSWGPSTFEAASLAKMSYEQHRAARILSTLSPTVSQPIEAQPIHALPMPKYDFQGNEPTPSQPVTGEEVEVVGWAYRGPRGGLIVTEQKPAHAPEARPVVFLSDYQALKSRLIAALSAQERG